MANVRVDDALARSLAKTTADSSYIIVVFSTPHEPTYEPDFVDPVRMDLKRHVQSAQLQQRDNKTDWDKLPLFEKYQFFTPGMEQATSTPFLQRLIEV